MKKILIIIICFVIAAATLFFIFEKNKQNSDLTKIKVAEVAHSIFYAPWYSAHSLGYFEDEGLDVEIILTSGVNN